MTEAPNLEGRNEMRLNGATMRNIVEFWLGHTWAGYTPTVDSVRCEGDVFIVKLLPPRQAHDNEGNSD